MYKYNTYPLQLYHPIECIYNLTIDNYNILYNTMHYSITHISLHNTYHTRSMRIHPYASANATKSKIIY